MSAKDVKILPGCKSRGRIFPVHDSFYFVTVPYFQIPSASRKEQILPDKDSPARENKPHLSGMQRPAARARRAIPIWQYLFQSRPEGRCYAAARARLLC